MTSWISRSLWSRCCSAARSGRSAWSISVWINGDDRLALGRDIALGAVAVDPEEELPPMEGTNGQSFPGLSVGEVADQHADEGPGDGRAEDDVPSGYEGARPSRGSLPGK